MTSVEAGATLADAAHITGEVGAQETRHRSHSLGVTNQRPAAAGSSASNQAWWLPDPHSRRGRPGEP